MKLALLFTFVAIFGVVLADYVVVEPQEETHVQSAAPTNVEHHGRTKRSPGDPFIAPLILGKTFLLGALLGPKLAPRRRYHHGPRHHYGGWGWSPPVHHGWGWGWSG